MFEYEKKVMLTAAEYFSVLRLMRKHDGSIQKQTNYYFDNDDLSMNEKGITCRIRSKDGKYKATVKNHNTEQPDCSIEIDLIEKEEFDPQVFNVFGLRCQGELVTDRLVLYKASDCEMVLDCNVYLGYTDFELEVEYGKENEWKAQRLIEDVGECLVMTDQLTGIDKLLERVGQGKSKSQRFFERLKKQK